MRVQGKEDHVTATEKYIHKQLKKINGCYAGLPSDKSTEWFLLSFFEAKKLAIKYTDEYTKISGVNKVFGFFLIKYYSIKLFISELRWLLYILAGLLLTITLLGIGGVFR